MAILCLLRGLRIKSPLSSERRELLPVRGNTFFTTHPSAAIITLRTRGRALTSSMIRVDNCSTFHAGAITDSINWPSLNPGVIWRVRNREILSILLQYVAVIEFETLVKMIKSSRKK